MNALMVGAPWQQTVDALLSNTKERSDDVTLVFEREIPMDGAVAGASAEALNQD